MTCLAGTTKHGYPALNGSGDKEDGHATNHLEDLHDRDKRSDRANIGIETKTSATVVSVHDGVD